MNEKNLHQKGLLKGVLNQVFDSLILLPFFLSLLPLTWWFSGAVAKSPMALMETNIKG